MVDTPLVKIRNLKKYFPVKKGFLSFGEQRFSRAVDGVDMDIPGQTTVGLAGESGSGKTTLGRVLLKLYEPTEGQIFFEEKEIFHLDSREMKRLRPQMQMIFQNPFASLNPRKSVRQILSDPLKMYQALDKEGLENRVQEILTLVELEPPEQFMDRYPHELSGGQRQRVAIGRAIATRPRFIVADEAVSSLDVSVKAQILTLMKHLQKDLGVSFLFISHDLAVLRSMAQRTDIMYLGKVVESAETGELFAHPRHPYTQALLSATPVPNPQEARERRRTGARIVLKGEIPSPVNPPSGCRFHTRCPYAQPKCSEIEPTMTEEKGRYFACHYPLS
jgi:oligopeptide/dipeptide ABC transporter ATP-binding protein